MKNFQKIALNWKILEKSCPWKIRTSVTRFKIWNTGPLYERTMREFGGARTHDSLSHSQALCQLSYKLHMSDWRDSNSHKASLPDSKSGASRTICATVRCSWAQWDSNPHFTASETARSTVGVHAHFLQAWPDSNRQPWISPGVGVRAGLAKCAGALPPQT